MSRGHNAEFRRLFHEEAEMRLATLIEQATAIEQGADPEPCLDAMFRDAHTLKGGAAVVGFEDLAKTLLELERELDDLRRGRTPLTPEVPAAVRVRAERVRALIAAEMSEAEAR